MAAPKILIVDDERDSTFALEKTLAMKGYTIITAEKGHTAIQLAQSEKPDLILLDIMLPDIHGGDIAKILQKDQNTKNIPIIFMSCLFTKQEESELTHKAGQFLMFAKPYNLAELLQAIENIVPIHSFEQQNLPEVKNPKILIIDDDRDFVTSLVIYLRKNKCEVSAGFDASTAVHQAMQCNPDLILLDLKLPGGDGLEVLERFERNIKLTHIPVVMISGYANPAIKERALKEGAVAFFDKPLDFDKILKTIRDILTKGQPSTIGENSNESH